MKIFITTIFILFMIATNIFADINDGLVAYYQFENNAHDSTSFQNNGTTTTQIVYENGVVGNSIILNSSSGDFIYLGRQDDFAANFINGNISIACWAKGDSYYLFSCLNCTGVYCLRFADGIVQFIFDKDWSDQVIIKNDEPINSEVFNHIAVTTEDNTFRLYINGKKIKEEIHNVNRRSHCGYNERGMLINARGIKANSDPLIPEWSSSASHILYLDDLRIYKRHISDNEIIELYEMGKDLNQNTILSTIVTASEILGYTASVGGATIKAIPHNLSTVTDIYGEFQLSNIPVGECILQIESSYFQTLTKTIQVNSGNNLIDAIEIFKPKCQNMYTQKEVDQLLDQMKAEKDEIIAEKETTISQLNTTIASMYTQGYLEEAIIEAEKRGELKYDINNDGKVGLEEVIKYLETLSGVRIESLIIFPENKKHFISE